MTHGEKPKGGDMNSISAGYVGEGPTLACHCTGRCRELGYCPCNPPLRRPCGHYFPWHGVIPPTYCPICGSYIGPMHCPPAPTWSQPTITYITNTTVAQQPQGESHG